MQLRELTMVYPYIVRYRVAADHVRILRVRHGARRPIGPGRPRQTIRARVRGAAALRLVEFSLFSCVPCANTIFPSLMTVEKIAEGS